MPEQEDNPMEQIKKWVVNDYFTPNIKSEVILDALLTDYAAEIIRKQGGPEMVFVTKEMSVLDEGRSDDRGEKIDYILTGADVVYMVELKTTDGSISREQAEKYWQNCEGRDFETVFGQKLLDIMSKRTGKALICGPGEEQLRALFKEICGDIKWGECAKLAKELLRARQWGSTHKYLYTMGQIMDYVYPKKGEPVPFWRLPLKLLYLTPSGSPPNGELMKHTEFYLHPEGKGSFSLRDAAEDLRSGDELARLLADIIDEIYGDC